MINFNLIKKKNLVKYFQWETLMKSALVNEVAPIPLQVAPHLKRWILNCK